MQKEEEAGKDDLEELKSETRLSQSGHRGSVSPVKSGHNSHHSRGQPSTQSILSAEKLRNPLQHDKPLTLHLELVGNTGNCFWLMHSCCCCCCCRIARLSYHLFIRFAKMQHARIRPSAHGTSILSPWCPASSPFALSDTYDAVT